MTEKTRGPRVKANDSSLPTPAKSLYLNVTDDDNNLNYDLAMDIIEFFQLSKSQAQLKLIKDEVLAGVARWESVTSSTNICRSDQQSTTSVFNV